MNVFSHEKFEVLGALPFCGWKFNFETLFITLIVGKSTNVFLNLLRVMRYDARTRKLEVVSLRVFFYQVSIFFNKEGVPKASLSTMLQKFPNYLNIFFLLQKISLPIRTIFSTIFNFFWRFVNCFLSQINHLATIFL